MTNFCKRGIRFLKDSDSSTSMTPEFGKRLIVKKGESTKVIVAGYNLEEIPLHYEHVVFFANVQDKVAWNLHVTCKSFEAEGAPRVCRICNEMLFCQNIKRNLVVPFYVYDLASYVIEGKTWSHTPKWWVLRKNEGQALTDNMEEKLKLMPGRKLGDCRGMVYKVSRIGQNASGSGNHFDFQGMCDLRKFFAQSPRVQWYIEKERDKGRKVSPEEAIQEFFGVPDPEKTFAPTPEKEEYFLQYVHRMVGDKTAKVSQQGGWETVSNLPLDNSPTAWNFGLSDGPTTPVAAPVVEPQRAADKLKSLPAAVIPVPSVLDPVTDGVDYGEYDNFSVDEPSN